MIYKFSMLIIIVLVCSGCNGEKEPQGSYRLLSLFEASESLDGKEALVTGYFGYYDGDIPVLFATYSDFLRQDGLYIAPLLFSMNEHAVHPNDSNVGDLCTFVANVWYQYKAPTLDNASLLKCQKIRQCGTDSN